MLHSIFLSQLLIWIYLKYSQSIRVPGSTVEFPLLRSDCLQGSFPDISTGALGSMKSANSHNYCLNSNGVAAPSVGDYISSSRNISSLQDSLGINPFTIEMWIRSNNLATLQTIVSIAPNNTPFYDNFQLIQIPAPVGNIGKIFFHFSAIFDMF